METFGEILRWVNITLIGLYIYFEFACFIGRCLASRSDLNEPNGDE